MTKHCTETELALDHPVGYSSLKTLTNLSPILPNMILYECQLERLSTAVLFCFVKNNFLVSFRTGQQHLIPSSIID